MKKAIQLNSSFKKQKHPDQKQLWMVFIDENPTALGYKFAALSVVILPDENKIKYIFNIFIEIY